MRDRPNYLAFAQKIKFLNGLRTWAAVSLALEGRSSRELVPLWNISHRA